jgi:hypothetical protein
MRESSAALTTFRLLGPTAQPCGERLLRPGSARLGLSQKGGLPVARRSEKEDGGSRPSTRARGGQQPSCPSLARGPLVLGLVKTPDGSLSWKFERNLLHSPRRAAPKNFPAVL